MTGIDLKDIAGSSAAFVAPVEAVYCDLAVALFGEPALAEVSHA